MSADPRTETIVAVATPAGRGGIGVVRVSGPAVPQMIPAICGRSLQPRTARVCRFTDGSGAPIDTGLALYFAGPESFTGEDVLELHAHGSPIVLDLLVSRVLELGARLAQPGEYTHRAYLNDKLDLAQAEAVADLIDCSSVEAARAALRSLQGEFSRAVTAVVEQVIQVRMYVEAAIDFPEEEVDFLNDAKLRAQLRHTRDELAQLTTRAQQGALLRNGFKVVIAGKPNAGKSSLMNALAGYDAAIVTEIEGTTRDVLREQINVDGLIVQLADTAGLRAEAETVEAEGIRRAMREVRGADHVLYVADSTRERLTDALTDEVAALQATCGVTVILNKADLVLHTLADLPWPSVAVSATTHAGLDRLRAHLLQVAGRRSEADDVFLARRRHLEALARAGAGLERAERQLLEYRAGELVAEELRDVQQALGEITGEFTSDDLLGRIFASFCIGK